jgi:chemotaxis protein CheD
MSPPARVLLPGEVALAARGDTLETLLGSCVAILLDDPARTLGGACHVVHASPGADAAHGPQALAALFGQLRARGVDPLHCKAWLVGGGHMFPDLSSRPEMPDVGAANVRWAREALVDLGIPIVAEDVGGFSYRRVRWTVGDAAPVIEAVAVGGTP